MLYRNTFGMIFGLVFRALLKYLVYFSVDNELLHCLYACLLPLLMKFPPSLRQASLGTGTLYTVCLLYVPLGR